MTLVAIAGWVLAASAFTLVATACRRWRRRLERLAEAEHELRGPLTALTIALAAPNGAAPRAGLQAELARVGCALADLTAARTGLPAPGPSVVAVDLGQVVRDSVSAWRPAARAAGVDLDAACGGRVTAVADPARLAQATGNLIANAIEHGRGPIEVRVHRQHDRARIEVIDAGPRPIALSRPRRAGGAATRGHGLRVAARVAAQHGGALELGRARAVTLTLPLRPVA